MKKVLLGLFIFVICFNVYSQVTVKGVLNKINMKGPTDMPDSLHMKLLVEQILQLYGNSFVYYNELKAGNYIFKIEDKKSAYSILISSKDTKKIEIKVNKIVSQVGGYTLSLDYKDFEKLVSQTNKSFGYRHELMGSVSIIERNNMLSDQDILPIEELQPEQRKTLDKQFTMDNFKDQYHNDLE